MSNFFKNFKKHQKVLFLVCGISYAFISVFEAEITSIILALLLGFLLELVHTYVPKKWVEIVFFDIQVPDIKKFDANCMKKKNGDYKLPNFNNWKYSAAGVFIAIICKIAYFCTIKFF